MRRDVPSQDGSSPEYPQSTAIGQVLASEATWALGWALQSGESRLSSGVSVDSSTQLEDLACLPCNKPGIVYTI